MQAKERQTGLTLISWLVILMVLGFFITLGLRLGPVYMQHYTVKNILTGLEQEPMVGRKSVREIRSLLEKRFDINGVENLSRDNIKIDRKGGFTTVQLLYEVRKPMIQNIDAIVTFEESITLVSH